MPQLQKEYDIDWIILTTKGNRDGDKRPIEASLMGIPVLSYKADSLEEVTMGLLNYYEPTIDDKALANEAIKVLDNPPSENELSNIKNTFAEKYSIDTVAKRIVEFLEALNK